MVKYAVFSTEWGYFGLAGDDRGLLRTHLPCGSRKLVKNRLLAGLENGCGPEPEYMKSLQRLIRDYFGGRAVRFGSDVAVNLDGLTDFKQRVLKACKGLSYGQKRTYGQIAGAAGSSGAARAVGNALACNPVPLIIPCHRVVCSGGGIGGFSAPGGCDLKARMLELEASTLLQTVR